MTAEDMADGEVQPAPNPDCKVPCGGRCLEDKIIKAGGMADASPFDAEKFQERHCSGR